MAVASCSTEVEKKLKKISREKYGYILDKKDINTDEITLASVLLRRLKGIKKTHPKDKKINLVDKKITLIESNFSKLKTELNNEVNQLFLTAIKPIKKSIDKLEKYSAMLEKKSSSFRTDTLKQGKCYAEYIGSEFNKRKIYETKLSKVTTLGRSELKYEVIVPSRAFLFRNYAKLKSKVGTTGTNFISAYEINSVKIPCKDALAIQKEFLESEPFALKISKKLQSLDMMNLYKSVIK